jgi:hypothetical protein
MLLTLAACVVAAPPGQLQCSWNVGETRSGPPFVMPAEISGRFAHDLRIIYEGALGQYPDMISSGWPGAPNTTSQVGLALCFRDMAFNPILNGSLKRCSRVPVPRVATYHNWYLQAGL